MADINELISLGIGSPSNIEGFITLGLQVAEPPAFVARGRLLTPSPIPHYLTPIPVSRVMQPAPIKRTLKSWPVK